MSDHEAAPLDDAATGGPEVGQRRALAEDYEDGGGSGGGGSGKPAAHPAKKLRGDDAGDDDGDDDDGDGGGGGDDDDDEDDDEDDESSDESDSDDGGGKKKGGKEHKKKKKKRRKRKVGASLFIDDEAEVDDEDDEDEDDIAFTKDDELLSGDDLPTEADLAAVRRRHNQRQNMQDLSEEQMKALVSRLEAKHANYRVGGGGGDDDDDFGGGVDEERDDVRQQSYLPTPRDPRMWLVRCKPGKEKEAVMMIMKKYFVGEQTGRRLLLKSVVASATLKGYVYVEALKDAHVREALDGLRSLISWKMKLVPIKEMVSVLRVPQKQTHIERNSWVRVKRGLYAGDVAQVVKCDEAQGRATIKLVPRLDLLRLSKVRGSGADLDDDDDGSRRGGGAAGGSKKRSERPPQAFFNLDDARVAFKGSSKRK